MELAVYNQTGTDTGRKVNLSTDVFGIEPNDHAIYLDVKHFLANNRQGTHKAKERNEISGSTRKLKKQKGTGTARAGSIKNPLFRGGGRVFGPRPKDHGFKLNKKTKRLARMSALSYKLKENGLMVLENVNFENPSTKAYKAMLKALSLEGKKTLLVLPAVDKNVVLSGRNLPKTKIMVATDLNTYEVLNADYMIVSEGAINVIESTLK
jgi:large subunit ribosomal protein L4